MRLTQVLGKQHIKRWFVRKWFVDKKNQRVPIDTNAESTLTALGIKLTDPQDIVGDRQIMPPVPPGSVNVIGLLEKPIPMDENHPLHHDRPCYLYNEHSMLAEGLAQAQNLANTVILHSGLPEQIEELAKENKSLLSDECNEDVKSCILRSFLFDAVQEKLPPFKDPARPAYNFPPIFGVPDYRKNRLMSDNLLSLCDSFASEPHGIVVRGGQLRTILDINGSLARFNINPGMLICGKNPLKPQTDPARTENLDLPDIFPFEPFVSLSANNFYEDTDIINIPPSSYVHTAVFHFNETKHVNLSEIPVNENQIQGRTLANSFVTTLALAKEKLENPTGELSSPLTIQGVHTNGQWYQFSVFQLNNFGTKGVKNVAWMSPLMRMFESAAYEKGVPTLQGYNPEVFSRLMSDNLLSLCDSFASEPHGIVVRGGQLRTILDINGSLARFNINPGMLICGKNPLKPQTDPARTENLDLPDIFPFEPFVSLSANNFYEDTDIINIPTSSYVHTAVFHFNDKKHVKSQSTKTRFKLEFNLDPTV